MGYNTGTISLHGWLDLASYSFHVLYMLNGFSRYPVRRKSRFLNNAPLGFDQYVVRHRRYGVGIPLTTSKESGEGWQFFITEERIRVFPHISKEIK